MAFTIAPPSLGASAASSLQRSTCLYAVSVRTAVLQQLDELCALLPDALRDHRYQRFRAMGVFETVG
jgi:acetyl-CoA carboxylase alpha subunit